MYLHYIEEKKNILAFGFNKSFIIPQFLMHVGFVGTLNALHYIMHLYYAGIGPMLKLLCSNQFLFETGIFDGFAINY